MYLHPHFQRGHLHQFTLVLTSLSTHPLPYPFSRSLLVVSPVSLALSLSFLTSPSSPFVLWFLFVAWLPHLGFSSPSSLSLYLYSVVTFRHLPSPQQRIKLTCLLSFTIALQLFPDFLYLQAPSLSLSLSSRIKSPVCLSAPPHSGFWILFDRVSRCSLQLPPSPCMLLLYFVLASISPS